MLDRLLHRDATSATEPMAGAPRILVIDDDPDEAELVRDSLARVGAYYRIETAESAEQGLARLAEGGYEAALVDYRLGEWTGLDVLRQASEQGSHTPMIMLTGERDPVLDQAATSFGAVDFLKKGKTTPEELERSIRFAAATGRALTAAREAEARSSAIEEISRILGEDGDAPQALDRVVGLLSEAFERPFVALYRTNGESFALAAQRGHRAAVQVVGPSGPIGNVVRMHGPSFVANQSSDASQRDLSDPQLELCLPLSSERGTFGVLLVGEDGQRPIGEAEQSTLASAASRITTAFAAAHDRLAAARRASGSRLSKAFVTRLSGTATDEELARMLAEACAAALAVTSTTVLRISGESATVVSSFGPDVPARDGDSTIRELDRIAIKDHRPASGSREIRTSAGAVVRVWEASLPVVRAGTVIGLLRVARRGEPFDVNERETASFVANLVALILPA